MAGVEFFPPFSTKKKAPTIRKKWSSTQRIKFIFDFSKIGGLNSFVIEFRLS